MTGAPAPDSRVVLSPQELRDALRVIEVCEDGEGGEGYAVPRPRMLRLVQLAFWSIRSLAALPAPSCSMSCRLSTSRGAGCSSALYC